MIEIKVNNKPLVLYRDTTISIEMNNSIFSSESIDGDIVYSFDIPIVGNEIALEFQHLPNTIKSKRFKACLLTDGIEVSNGYLVVQKISKNSMSVGIICNTYPQGWSGKSIRDVVNIPIQISPEGADLALHKSSWLNFLMSTTQPDSNIKFGLIFNEENYGSSNENFGFWNGGSIPKLINRLYLKNGNIVSHSDQPLIKVFNESHIFADALETNQFAFCPQLRLKKLFQSVLESSGHKVEGSFFKDRNVSDVFLQSTTALDGDIFQFGNKEHNLCTYQPSEDDGRFSHPVYIYRNNYGDWFYEYEGNTQWNTGSFDYRGKRIDTYPCWELFSSTPYLLLEGEGTYIPVSFGNIRFSTPGNYTLTFRISIPSFKRTGYQYAMPACVMLVDGQVNQQSDEAHILAKVEYDDVFNQTTLSGTFSLTVNQYDVSSNKTFHIRVAYIAGGTQYRTLPTGLSSIYVSFESETGGTVTNVFCQHFNIGECLPHLKVGDFINIIRKTFGLAYFYDGANNSIEISTVKELMESKSIDLSEYLLIDETEMEIEEKAASVTLSSTLEEENPSDENIIPPVRREKDLPDAYENINRYCYVEETNAYWKSTKNEDAESIWSYDWEKVCGNCNKMIIGNGDDIEEIELTTKIPTAKRYGIKDNAGNISMIPDIPFSIESRMFGNEEGKDIILLQYRGKETLNHRHGVFEFELMTPISNDGFNLTIDRENSIGCEYIKPWMNMYTAPETHKYKFRMPTIKILDLAQLLKPQFVDPKIQTRWMIVNGERTMPKKITIQIDNNNGMGLVEVESVKPA